MIALLAALALAQDPTVGSASLGGAIEKCNVATALRIATADRKFAPRQRECLEEVGATVDGDDRRTISFWLIDDAAASGDAPRWERLVRAHLEADATDAEIAWRLGVYLSQRGAPYSDDALAALDTALANQGRWPPDLRKDKVAAVYRLRVVVAQAAWARAERGYLTSPDPTWTERRAVAQAVAQAALAELEAYIAQRQAEGG